MLGYLTLILVCQLAGEIVASGTGLPVPGPVIGMVLLFCWLMLRREMPSDLETVGGFLHRYLPLLFVPAGVGIITHLDLLARSWLPLAAVIVVGTALTIGVTGLVMQSLNRRRKPLADEEGA
jgi:holin-like protein